MFKDFVLPMILGIVVNVQIQFILSRRDGDKSSYRVNTFLDFFNIHECLKIERQYSLPCDGWSKLVFIWYEISDETALDLKKRSVLNKKKFSMAQQLLENNL